MTLHTQSGSTVMVFVIVMIGLMTLTTVVWRMISYTVDTAHARQLHYQSVYYVEGLRRWGVQFIVQTHDALAKHVAVNDSVSLSMNQWPVYIDTVREVQSSITITRCERDAYELCVTVSHSLGELCSTCTVRRCIVDKQQQFSVSGCA